MTSGVALQALGGMLAAQAATRDLPQLVVHERHDPAKCLLVAAPPRGQEVKYSKDGKFIKAWGKTGYGPGEFRTLHSLAIDSRGQVFVADRSNNRIRIFEQEGSACRRDCNSGR